MQVGGPSQGNLMAEVDDAAAKILRFFQECAGSAGRTD
jgi:hypothetical protein